MLVIATTVSVVDNVPLDLFSGQVAPQAATYVIPAGSVNIGGVQWEIGGTLLNNSGANRIFQLTILCNGVTLYDDTSQIMGINAVARVWKCSGSITRKSATTGWFVNQMFGNNGSPTGPITGIGPLDAVGSGLSPSLPHSLAPTDIAGLDWSIAQRVEFRVSWTTVAPNTTFSISGGYIYRFGS